jgi:hypothetical protein
MEFKEVKFFFKIIQLVGSNARNPNKALELAYQLILYVPSDYILLCGR